jgi:hypothetical protein
MGAPVVHFEIMGGEGSELGPKLAMFADPTANITGLLKGKQAGQ